MNNNPTTILLSRLLAVAALLVANEGVSYAQKTVTQPGDAIIASSSNMPGSEGVANAIDGQPTKYLNFDLDADAAGGPKPAGFAVTPSIGVTRLTGISMQSANDAVDRDPKVITIEGSNDDVLTDYASGNWELIVKIDNIPSWTSVFGDTDNRYKTQTFSFTNYKAYKHYRWIVLETQGPSTCCMQIAEVSLLGGLLPGDITQPGDPIVASSSNMPGSEGVANVIDNQPTKYLNFDLDADAAGGPKPAGFIVTPSVGATVVSGMTLLSANDAIDRDPKVVTIEGSNDDTVTDWAAGNWELVKKFDAIPSWTSVFGDTDNRYKQQTFLFDNVKPYKHYRWTVTETQGPSTCCMQIAEVELLGSSAPKDITQPGDAIIASSSNMPGSEGVANVIDNQPTKYLNFDLDADATGGPKPAGFAVTPAVGATVITGVSMQSANDAVDRDPKVITIEGSNDDALADYASGNWELIVKIENIPAWTAVFGDTDNRYKTQYFYFPNSKSYKHYRWVVLETQGPSTCCMQIAEVELLAVTEGADCNKAKFLVQPVNTPVLAGNGATFFTTVNGPWPLQWYKNGSPIPGATATMYTTEAVTAANATNVYSVQIVGCEMSSEVKAVIFTSSATKSVGISFRGGGANGTPTVMADSDIAGLHPQAHWNNAANAATGLLPDDTQDPPLALLDSDGNASTMTFDFATTGAWGSGTGTNSATARMLNGLNHNQAGATDMGLTFNNVPAGKHSVILYMVGIPLQFQNANYTVTGTSSKTYYVTVVNVDDYNAAPGFYRGVSTDPSKRDLATYVRFDDVSPATDGTIKVTWTCETSGYDRGTPVNALQLVLNSTAAGAPPAITTQPQPTMGLEGSTVILSVTGTGEGLTYQWRKNGRNLPNGGHVSGATTAKLMISDLSADDEAVYSVAVFNAGGSVISKNAMLSISKFDVNDAMVSYWKFNETSGSSAANTVASGKPAAATGTSTWGTGKVGGAFAFDGVTYMVASDYTKPTKSISVSGWVNVDASATTPMAFIRNCEGTLRVGTDSSPAPAGQFELGLVQDTTDFVLRLSAGIRVGPNIPRATATAAFPLGSWHHVAFSADGAQLRLFIDGVQVASADYLGNIITPDTKYLSLGALLSPDESGTLGMDLSNPNAFVGKVDEFAVWARALSVDEVLKIYTAGKDGKELTTVVLEPPVTDLNEFGIGLNFGADEYSGGNQGTLLATDVAGVPAVAQANWNNLSLLSGTNTAIKADANGTSKATKTKVVWSSANTWSTTGRGEENNGLTGTDKTLMLGYLDTGAATTSSVTITGLPDQLTTAGYDVYVYALGGVAAKGGGYRILDAKTGEVLKDYVRVQGPAVPTSYIQAVPSEDPTVWSAGNYVVFSGVGSANIIVEATTAGGLGYQTTTGDPRAPMNAIQLVSPPTAAPPKDFGLVAYWPFDDSLTDVAGGHNGIAHGGPLTFGAGKFGQGVDLEFAKSQYVEAGGSESDFDMGGGSVTISTWFRVDAWDVEWQCLVAKGEGENYRLARSGSTDNIQYAGGVGEPAVAAPGVKDGNIHHVVALTRGGVQTELWIDGKLYETAANPTITDNDKPLLIGANPDTSPLRYWNGLIDDIAIWSRALSADEITAIWNGGAGKTIEALYGPFAVAPAEFTAIQLATDGKITIEWTGGGTLQSSPTVTGPYTDVAGAASPYTFTPSGNAGFYQIKQ